jgi:hypothetical protein
VIGRESDASRKGNAFATVADPSLVGLFDVRSKWGAGYDLGLSLFERADLATPIVPHRLVPIPCASGHRQGIDKIFSNCEPVPYLAVLRSVLSLYTLDSERSSCFRLERGRHVLCRRDERQPRRVHSSRELGLRSCACLKAYPSADDRNRHRRRNRQYLEIKRCSEALIGHPWPVLECFFGCRAQRQVSRRRLSADFLNLALEAN